MKQHSSVLMIWKKTLVIHKGMKCQREIREEYYKCLFKLNDFSDYDALPFFNKLSQNQLYEIVEQFVKELLLMDY